MRQERTFGQSVAIVAVASRSLGTRTDCHRERHASRPAPLHRRRPCRKARNTMLGRPPVKGLVLDVGVDGSNHSPSATPAPQSPAHRAAQLAVAMAAARAGSTEQIRPPHGPRDEHRRVDAHVHYDRLALRVDAAEAGVERLERLERRQERLEWRADAFSEDLAALNRVFCDYSAKMEAQATKLESAMELNESACTVEDLGLARELIETQLDSQFDVLNARFESQIRQFKAENEAHAAALTTAARREVDELTAWRTQVTGQLEKQSAQCLAAEKAVSIVAKLEATEARVTADLEAFAKQFHAAAQNVEGNAHALDQKLQASVSLLTQAIQKDSTNASRHLEQLAHHVRHSLETGQKSVMRTQRELELLAAQLGSERQDLKQTLAAIAARTHHPSRSGSSSASDVRPRHTARGSDANNQISVNIEAAEHIGQQMAALLARMDERGTKVRHPPALATVGAVSAGAPGALAIDEAEPPEHAAGKFAAAISDAASASGSAAVAATTQQQGAGGGQTNGSTPSESLPHGGGSNRRQLSRTKPS